VVGEARDRQRPRDGAERDDELLVADVDDSVLRLDVHAATLVVDVRRPAEHEVGVRAHDPQWNDDMARLERAGCRLRQQGV
jgi:hypothetical protein